VNRYNYCKSTINILSYGIQDEGAYDTSMYNYLILEPLCDNISCAGINLRGDGCYAAYNITDGFGVGFYTRGSTNMKMYNNVIVNAVVGIDNNNSGSYTITFQNNVFDDISSRFFYGQSTNTLVANYNLYENSSAVWYVSGEKNWAQWQALSHDANGIHENPEYNANFYPTAGGNLIDAGTDVSIYPFEDFIGNTVPDIAVSDLGVYEYTP
jgi:hypothetical protein